MGESRIKLYTGLLGARHRVQSQGVIIVGESRIKLYTGTLRLSTRFEYSTYRVSNYLRWPKRFVIIHA